MVEYCDVIVVGAGLSGICAGYYLQEKCPNKSYKILESRNQLGGTWDLFRYPGIRSDSDMYTLGYSFKPWTHKKAIALAPTILSYLQEAADENDITPNICFNHFVKSARWSSVDNRWLIDVEKLGSVIQFKCRFLFMCSGYYDYNSGHSPDFPNSDKFQGEIVHPQHWPEDLNTEGKKIVVVGSGATAVTLIPQLAATAKHVTMLQRSPTYVVSRPSEDVVANFFRRIIPFPRVSHFLTRWVHILVGMYFYSKSKSDPVRSKTFIIQQIAKEIGEEQATKHFTPRYNPWDQRLCLVPDNDLFNSIRSGKASVVTDTIKTVTANGIEVSSGELIDADVIVSATGLKLAFLGGMEVFVDDIKIELSQTWAYKHMIFSGIPNMACCFGYPNASWTLKAELNCLYFCRLINHMDKNAHKKFVTVQNDSTMEAKPWLALSSGYIQRAVQSLPKLGATFPWKPKANYIEDLIHLTWCSIEDPHIQFSSGTNNNSSSTNNNHNNR